MMPCKTWSTPVKEEKLLFIPCIICATNSFKPFFFCDGFSYVKCRHCGLVQMNPQPASDDVENRYGELYGEDYFNYELENEKAFLDLQKRALSDAGFERLEQKLFSKKTKPLRPSVLDLGCATGAMLEFLKNRGWQVTGVEISPSGKYAKEKKGLDIHFESFEKCNFPAESFDIVLASHFLEHVNNPKTIIREAWRVLRSNSYLMLTTPNISGFQARLFKNQWRSAIFDHLYLFSKSTIKKLLKTEGFIVEGIYTWGGLAAGTAPYAIKSLADKIVKILGLGDVMIVKAMKRE